jgi:2-oxo-4-hydroxy-4-carboxy-5-ureidoimidazoline decarboxylase
VAALSLNALNEAPEAGFTAALSDLFEHSPWVVDGIAQDRPFASAAALHEALMRRVRVSGKPAQLRLVMAHPELAGKEAVADALTEDSAGEQGRLGFNRLPAAEHAALAEINAAYRARFGFPCIVALCRHDTRETVLADMRRRLTADPDAELATAIDEIGFIVGSRLAKRLA